MIKLCKRLFQLMGALVTAALLFILYLTITEYRPEDRSLAAVSDTAPSRVLSGSQVRLMSWNIGHGGLGNQSDFFMDGGTMVNPPSQEDVLKNMEATARYLGETPADFYLIQELDRDSSRTDRVDQAAYYEEQIGLPWAYGPNYRCFFVPYPWPPLGRMDSGVATFSAYEPVKDPIRISLPCPFNWPVRIANTKRCVLVNTYDLEDTDKKLVVVNLHLEAYDDGEGKIAQTRKLLEILEGEYEKGNYVIAGGDFNQSLPGSLERYPHQGGDLWEPGALENDILPEGWQFAYDPSVPTCRSLDKPYDSSNPNHQFYVLDGFLLSPNVQPTLVETQDLGFVNSDHNPVILEARLLP